jgi:hypothetical protein
MPKPRNGCFVALFALFAMLASASLASASTSHVTVYPQGDALFYEKKVFSLTPGVQSLPLVEAEQATGFQVFPVGGSWPQGVESLGLYTVPQASSFWEQWVGKQVHVYDAVNTKYVKGMLKSYDRRNNVLLVEVGGSLWRSLPAEVLVRDIPLASLSTVSPSASLKLNSTRAVSLPLDVFYERSGLSTGMLYTWRLPSESETTGAVLDASLLVNNGSSDALSDVKLNAMFGANRQPNYHHAYAMKTMRAEMAMDVSAAPMVGGAPESETVGELMMLRIPGTFSLQAGQSVTLPYKTFRLGKEAVQRFVYAPGWWWQSGNETYTAPTQPVEHWLEVSNWGEQLPEGAFKAFQPDSQGNLQLVGEGQQAYHVKNEALRIRLGVAQQIRVTKKQVAYDYNKATKVSTLVYETTLTNTKTSPVAVDVYEYTDPSWKLAKHNGVLAQVQGVPIAFRIPLKAEEKRTLTYTLTHKD